MKFLLTLFVMILASAPAWSSETSWSYSDERGSNAQVMIYDVPGQLGEEMIRWQLPEGTFMIKPDAVSNGSYEANLFIETNSGQVLRDQNLSLSFGTSFDQINTMLNDPEFRAGFDWLPSSCAESAAGFMMVMDNLSGEFKGYCLERN